MSEFVELPVSLRSKKRRTVCGVGINDADYIVAPKINGKVVVCPFYKVWCSMLNRAYSEKVHARCGRYTECSVSSEWHVFSTFKAWMINQEWVGKQLDKDILIPGNKVYGPDSCLFVSGNINKLLCDRAGSRGNYPQGVTFSSVRGLYQSCCSVDGRTVHIGFYSSVDAAEYAYLTFKSELIINTSNIERSCGNNKLGYALELHSEILKKKAKEIFTKA